ncbi:MAG: hypothetical protein M1318_00590 [Firmicutes bacterium]|nr:hypothetical protein [Bacillota bacterium]
MDELKPIYAFGEEQVSQSFEAYKAGTPAVGDRQQMTLGGRCRIIGSLPLKLFMDCPNSF